MKILLVNPLWPRERAGRRRFRRAWPPLDLLVAAAMLRQRGHEPRLYDFRASQVTAAQYQAAVKWADLIILQTTPLDRWQCPDLDLAALGQMATLWPRDRLIVAGAHGTLHPELVLDLTGAQAVIRGEPEQTIVELAETGGQPRGMSGMSYLQGGLPIHEPDRSAANLDELPVPAYDLVDLRTYGYELLGPCLALLETSRGCPYSCIFCLKIMYGDRMRSKSRDRVLTEVEDVVVRHHARTVYFIDLEFTMNRSKTVALCQEFIRGKWKFTWACQTRVDAVDPDLLSLMKTAGCRLIHFGLESGSERVLATINKKINLDQIRRAIAWCRDVELNTAGFFLFGLPGETRQDRRATMALARQLNPTYASFHVAAPYPGTPLGRLVTDPNRFPACLNPAEALALARDTRRAFLSFYLRPGYILGHSGQGKPRNFWPRLRLFWEFIR